MIDTWAATQKLMEDTGLAARELAEMDLSEYARVTGRQAPAEAALAALDAQHEGEHQAPQQPALAPEQTAPERPDVGAMDWAEYAAYRERSGIAARSAEGMSRAEVHLMGRMERRNIPPAGRTAWYSGQ